MAAISARGYTVARNLATGAVLTRAAQAAPGDLLELHFADGAVTAEVVAGPGGQ